MYPGPSEIKMNRLLLPSSLTKANLDHMIFQQVVMADGNQYVAVDNGRLIDPDSGDIIWAPTEPAAGEVAPTSMPTITPKPSDQIAQAQQTDPEVKSADLDPWIITACAAAVVAAGVVVVASIRRRNPSK